VEGRWLTWDGAQAISFLFGAWGWDRYSSFGRIWEMLRCLLSSAIDSVD
jgi:hypothetical protein